MEEWRIIAGRENYQVSDLGRVRNTKTGRILKGNRIHRKYPGLNSYGHEIIRVSVYLNGKTFGVHRLVLRAFVGPCPAGMVGCHDDGDASNNRLDNLRWDTPEENVADVFKHYGRRRNPNPYQIGGRKLASALLCGILGFG